MAYIRTLRNPMRSRQLHSVSGSLACAATRPFALCTAVRHAPAPASPAPIATEQAALAETAAPLAEPPP